MRATRAGALVGAALTVTGVVGLAVGAGQPALATGVYDAHATADGMRAGIAVNDFLVFQQLVDGGGPTAQALVDGFGDSRAFAALPYPGETALGLPAQAGAPAGYPLIAQSSYPTQPKADLGAGPYQLQARSDSAASSASGAVDATGSKDARAGFTRATASAKQDPTTGTVTADAESLTEAVEVAGVLTISRVHSHARVVRKPGAKPVVTTDTEVGEMSVAGTPVGLTDKGLVVAGTTVPLPPDSSASQALQGAGVAVSYLAAHKGGDGEVTAPGVAVSVTHKVSGVGTVVTTYTLGGAIAGARPGGSQAGTFGSGGATASVGGTTATGTGGGNGSTPASTLPGAAGPAGSSSAGAALPPSTATAPPSTGRQPEVAGGAGVAVRPTAANPGPALDSVYALLALVGLLVVGAATVFRLIAVRLVWTS